MEKLWERVIWDHKGWRAWNEVAAEARQTGKKIHVGRLFSICIEKGSELGEMANGES